LFLLACSDRRALILADAERAELSSASPAPHGGDPDESIALLENHALECEPELFNGVLAQALGCSLDLAERIVREPSGEPLAVALAALGATPDATVRILVSGELRSGAKYTRIGALVRRKDGLNPAAARCVIAALIGAQKERRGRHQPVLEPSRAAPAATTRGLRADPDAPPQRVFAFTAQGALKSR
jgi:hypothetical protein